MAALVETMMSANNVVPWHRQGNVLDGYPTIDVAAEKSGLTWSVGKRQLFDKDGNAMPCFALCRDTDNRFYGTCTEAYKVYQNSEAFQWCKPLVESGEWRLETAGALKNGQVCWILMNQGTVSILPGDELRNYLLLTWSHDGKTSVRLGLTSVRVVCNNTLTQALNQDASYLQKFAHNSGLQLKLEDAYKLYSATVRSFADQATEFGALADVELKKSEREEFVDAVVSEAHKITEDDDLDDMTERFKRGVDRTRNEINWFIDNSLGQRELKIQNNLWGVFNGVEAWAEKARSGKRISDRGMDILFGRGKQIVDFAYDYAKQLA